MIDHSVWEHQHDGETFLNAYAKATLWERFHSVNDNELRLHLADGSVSDNIKGGRLLEGDSRRSISGYIPSFTIEGSDGPTTAIHLVETLESDWSDQERRER